MDEVIALENQIRKTLAFMAAEAQARGETTTNNQMVLDALAILAGKPTSISGTRLERLRAIAAGLDKSIGEL